MMLMNLNIDISIVEKARNSASAISLLSDTLAIYPRFIHRIQKNRLTEAAHLNILKVSPTLSHLKQMPL